MGSTSTTSPVVAVVGETASGKSALGMEIARRFDGEIICADSRTVYEGMDIGTAKPTAAEQQEIPHHLLDIVEPGDHFTAADFKQQAQKVVSDCARRNKLPLLVGGTGLYVDAVIFDYQFGKKGTLAQRQELSGQTADALQDMLIKKQLFFPEKATTHRQIIRTLERGDMAPDDRSHMRPHTLVLGVQVSRTQLRTRIEKRVEVMFRQGLRHEVAKLVRKYGWHNEALTGVGYREFQPFFEGKASMGEVKRQIVQNTLHLAKRQRTWFKRNPAIIWVESAEQAIAEVSRFVGYNQKV